jgi:tripeptidyl-peptidase I
VLSLLASSLTCESFLRNHEQSQYRVEDSLSIESHVFKETIPLLSSRDDIEKRDRVSHDHIHHVVFVVQQRNMDELTRILHDVSDPLSVNYGQHMSREQVSMMTSNPEARDAVVKYINANGATLVSETLSSEYITASAPISVWERVLNTEFFTFHQTQHDGTVLKVVRAERYWIPRELDEHVESVFNTIQMPLHQLFGSSQRIPRLSEYENAITPAKLRIFYNIGSSYGSNASTQAIYASLDQSFSPKDLSLFQYNFDLKDDPVKTSIGGYSSDERCKEDPSYCNEGNLDIQYIMGISPYSPTTYWYTDNTVGSWLVDVSNTAEPPLVLSISYGLEESMASESELNSFNTDAIKLSARGVTIVVSSGDDGAVSSLVRTEKRACGYSPIFPASNPYVVSVGATSVS